MSQQPKNVKLAFNKPVPFMLDQAHLFHAQLTADLADFTAVDTTIDLAFLTNFQTAITDAENAEDPTQASGTLVDLTAEVNALMAQARNSVQELYFFLGKAFPGKQGKLKSYGKDNYVKARDSHPRMVTLMENATDMLVDDGPDLITAGYAQAKIDAFGALYASLASANQTQEQQKGVNLDLTEEYYQKLNAVWAIMSQISELSKIVYINDFVKRKNYLLYDPSTTGLAFAMTVPVAPGVAFHHILAPLEPTTQITFRIVSGNGSAWVCFANADGDPCNWSHFNVQGPDEVHVNYGQISNGSGQYLRVTQDGSNELRLNVLVPGV